MSHRTRRAQGDEFLSESLPRLLSKIYKTYSDRDMKVLEFLQPEELRQKIDFSLPEDPVDNRVLESLAEQVIHYSVKTGHPYFFNQLFNGVDAFSLSGSIINEALNSSAYTYELGPVITLIEQEIIEKFSTEYIGYRKITQKYVENLEKFPALWDSRSKVYSNKDAKKRIWADLATLVGILAEELQIFHKPIELTFQRSTKGALISCLELVERSATKNIPFYEQTLFLLPTLKARSLHSNLIAKDRNQNENCEDGNSQGDPPQPSP
ncbi:hypothetical protein EB796_011463 [Bugula neritina]|uniref:MADF domain-containing protein n=1 Tax=Bugula neritina TaxID=10212 RepID=A0A7J7JWE2_BUGNE|nr:hypothetical protein EB796_011463 [Bugula neritina]